MADQTRIAEIIGCQITAGTDGWIRLGEGYFYLPNNRRLLSDGTAQAQIPAGQAIGWLHAYGREASNNVAVLVLSADAPSAPYRGSARFKGGAAPDQSLRYLGSGRIEAVGTLRAGKHLTTGSKGNRIRLNQAQGALPVAANIAVTLLGGTPGQASQSMANFVPPTSTEVTALINNTTGAWLYIGRPAMGTLSNTNHDVAVQPNSMVEVDLNLDADLTITYLASTTSLLGPVLSLTAGNIVIRPRGYLFDR